MSVINKIAFFQNRRDEVPNQELAKDLVKNNDKKGVREIAENLWNTNQNIQNDCIKVLYEVGYLNPKLITPYVDDFLKLLKNKNNRLVWGGMTALSAIAEVSAKELFTHHLEIRKATDNGSVITKDNGVKTLAVIASANDEYSLELFPYLLNLLATCRPKDVPQYSEKILVAVNDNNKKKFIQVLEKRMSDLTSSQLARVKRVAKEAEAR